MGYLALISKKGLHNKLVQAKHNSFASIIKIYKIPDSSHVLVICGGIAFAHKSNEVFF
jgi:hypothetical protein